MLIRKNPPHTLLILAGMLAALPVSAEEAATRLESITVSATRFPTRLENAPGQIEILTADDLEKRNDVRLSDSLKQLPGIHVQTGRGVLQPIQSMAMRGIPDERRIQVLLDGVPLNDGYSGGLNFGALPPDAIDRVEVLYGPMSSLYGGNAMAGVVSYTTRMPTKTEFAASVGYGNPFSAGKAPENLRKTSLSGGTKFDNDLQLLAGGHWLATDGYRSEWVTGTTAPAAGFSGWSSLPQKNGAAGYLLGNKGRTEWNEDGEFLKLEQRLSGGSRWRFGWQRQNYTYTSVDPQTYLRNAAGTPVFTGCCGASPYLFLNGEGDYERNIYQAGYDSELLGGLLKVSAAYADIATNSYITPTTGATVSGGPGRIANSPAQSQMLDAFWNREFDQHGLTLGLAWRADQAKSEEFTLSNWQTASSLSGVYAKASGESTTTGVYAQDEWRLRPALTAHLGLRYDYWRNSDGSIRTPGWTPATQVNRDYASRDENAWSPKVALVWQANDALTLRSSLGSAFRAPSLYELYRSTRVTYTILANPELKPETVQTWDIGADFKPWQGGEFKLTLFANRMHDLIYIQGSGAVRNRINAERAESQGVTASLSHQLTSATRIFGSLTHTNSTMKQNSLSPLSEGKQLTFLPKDQATLGADSRFGPWTLAMNARYASKQYASDDNSDVANGVPTVYDAYVVADAKVSYRIDRNFTAALSIDNLFNREYFSYYPTPGRSWFAELSYKY